MTVRNAVVVALVGLALPAHAQMAQRWPFAFDPSVAADPAGTQKKITDGQASLPALPVANMQTRVSGNVTLWLWPETTSLLDHVAAAGDGQTDFMPWPHPTVLCGKHAAFAVPTLLAPGAPQSCSDADAQIRAKLADVGACRGVEEPERFALTYTPAKVDSTTTASIETLIGVAGEALSHPPVPAHLVPDEWIARLRTILLKLRHDPIAAALADAHARYADARSLLAGNASCFDAGAAAALATSLDGLTGELDAAGAVVDKLRSDGTAAEAHDAMCVAARGNVRPALPYPSLSDDDRRWVAFWLGGLYWRMRGGGLIPLGSTQAARLDFLLQPFTLIGQLTGGQDGADAAFQIYLAIFEGWSDWQDMGHVQPGGDKYADLVDMTSRGGRQVAGAANLLGGRRYDTTLMTAGGLQMGPCYFYAYEPLGAFRYAPGLTAPYSGFIDWPTATAEFCSGGSSARGFAEVLLTGTPTGTAQDLCAGRQCGDDGCGKSCGSCAAGQACSAGGSCVAGAGGAGGTGGGAGGGGAGGGAGGDGNGGDGAGGGDGSGVNGNGDTTRSGCAMSGAPSSSSSPWAALALAFAIVYLARRRRAR
jgi:MYXO-CTERM domain-containing protein